MTSTSEEDTQRDTPAPPRKVIHLPNVEAYDQWAAVYDTDGNILQALDSYALMQTMLAHLLKNLPRKFNHEASADDALYITDLGCGTGRATRLLLSTLRAADSTLAETVAGKGYGTIMLTGLDASSGMLAVANDKVPAFASIGDSLVLNAQFWRWDLLDPAAGFTPSEEEEDGGPGVEQDRIYNPEAAHAIMSTLVLEHLPLDVYFERAKSLLRPGGVLLITNMHDNMGNSAFGVPQNENEPGAQTESNESAEKRVATGAGFIDAATNTKIRAAMGFAHSIDEVVEAAKKAGFELVDDRVDEMSVEPWMFESGSSWEPDGEGTRALLGDRGKKWIGIKCWFGIVFRLGS